MKKSYTPKPNSGIAFTNKFKTSEKQPSFVVQEVRIGGRAYKGAFWERTDKNGNPFISFIFEDAVGRAKPSRTSNGEVQKHIRS